jgi:cytosine/adenosine deaminase-related metal-dependent hydrolase
MITYSADYILVSANDSPALLKNAELTADEISGKILYLKNNSGAKIASAVNRGFKTLIIPGFINSHTHTDLTFMPDDTTPRVFSRWVLSLIEKRKSLSPEEKINIRLKAFKESVESGTTMIGDIIEPASLYNLRDMMRDNDAVPRVKGFIELRGIDPVFADEKAAELKNLLYNNAAAFKENKKYFSPGISPHSIYSVSKNLFKEILKVNIGLKLKIAVHCAEHTSETAFISGSGGDIADNLLPSLMLSKFSVPPEFFTSPVFYLNYLKVLDKNVSLIHANEIGGEDIGIIKETGAGIIHCPRSNAFFNSKKLPLKKIIDEGIPVSLGTDSLFSNASLDILDELKYAQKIHPEVSSKDLFFMATEGGAKALSFEGVTGTLSEDSYADFTIFKIGDAALLNEDNIYDNIISLDKNDILGVAVGGKIVYNNP